MNGLRSSGWQHDRTRYAELNAADPDAHQKVSADEFRLRDDNGVYPRPLTARERAVLIALLTVELHGVELLRAQAAEARVFGGCGCGCPSIDFFEGSNEGMTMIVNANIADSETFDGLFLYTVDLPDVGRVLGGIEWVGQSEIAPDELPDPENLTITVAGP